MNALEFVEQYQGVEMVKLVVRCLGCGRTWQINLPREDFEIRAQGNIGWAVCGTCGRPANLIGGNDGTGNGK